MWEVIKIVILEVATIIAALALYTAVTRMWFFEHQRRIKKLEDLVAVLREDSCRNFNLWCETQREKE